MVPLEKLRWRVGRKLGRSLYAMVDDEPGDDDIFIGVMDTPELASEVVRTHNLDLVYGDTGA